MVLTFRSQMDITIMLDSMVVIYSVLSLIHQEIVSHRAICQPCRFKRSITCIKINYTAVH